VPHRLRAGYERTANHSELGRWTLAFLDCAPFVARALAVVQSLLSLGLIVLFVLALRRRFRMA
jgi:hypothetical protein